MLPNSVLASHHLQILQNSVTVFLPTGFALVATTLEFMVQIFMYLTKSYIAFLHRGFVAKPNRNVSVKCRL